MQGPATRKPKAKQYQPKNPKPKPEAAGGAGGADGEGHKPRRRKRGQRKGQQNPAQHAPSQAAGSGGGIEHTEDPDPGPEVDTANAAATTTLVANLHCLICCDPIRVHSVGQCNHRGLCSMCSLRRRELYKQLDCCLCKAPLQEVAFTSDEQTPFDALDLRAFVHDSARGLYFQDKAYRDQVIKIFDFTCTVCHASLASLAALQRHLQQQHDLSYCDLCLEHKKVFLREQVLYSPADLDKHKKGAGESDMERHQLCEFCKRLYYDKDALYHHLTMDHYTCHICERDGIRYQYYRNYKSLEEHFRNEHFLCEEPQCLEKGFVVFRTALDLKGHDVATHLSDRKLSKSEAKAARTLDAAVLFADSYPRREQGREERGKRRRGRGKHEPFVFSPEPAAVTTTSTSASNMPEIHSGIPSVRGTKDNQNKEKAQHKLGKVESTEPVESEKESDQRQSKKRDAREGTAPAEPPNLQSQVEMQVQQSISKEERQARNRVLIDKILLFLGPERFDGFKKLSAELRLGHITPAQYYDRFMHAFGWEKASELFPELVDLLPDPVLRAALLVLHKNAKESDYPQFPDPVTSEQLEKEKEAIPIQRTPSPQPNENIQIRPFMKSTNSGPPPWAENSRTTGGAWTSPAPPARSEQEFPALPAAKNPTSVDEYLDDYDDQSSGVFPEANDRFHVATNAQGTRKSKKGKQNQVLLRFG